MQKLDSSQKECDQLVDKEKVLREEVSNLRTKLAQSTHVSTIFANIAFTV